MDFAAENHLQEAIENLQQTLCAIWDRVRDDELSRSWHRPAITSKTKSAITNDMITSTLPQQVTNRYVGRLIRKGANDEFELINLLRQNATADELVDRPLLPGGDSPGQSMPRSESAAGVTPLQAVQRALEQSGRNLPPMTDDEIRKFILGSTPSAGPSSATSPPTASTSPSKSAKRTAKAFAGLIEFLKSPFGEFGKNRYGGDL